MFISSTEIKTMLLNTALSLLSLDLAMYLGDAFVNTPRSSWGSLAAESCVAQMASFFIFLRSKVCLYAGIDVWVLKWSKEDVRLPGVLDCSSIIFPFSTPPNSPAPYIWDTWYILITYTMIYIIWQWGRRGKGEKRSDERGERRGRVELT